MNNESSKKDDLQGLKTDLMIHGKVNLLLLTVIARDAEAISRVLQNHGYKPFFYQNGLDPFVRAIEINDGGSLSVITEYLENNEEIREEFVTHQNFVRPMETSHIPFKKLFIESFMREPAALDTSTITPIVHFPIGSFTYDASTCNSIYLDHDLRDSLISTRKNYKKYLGGENSEMAEVRLLVTNFKVNYWLIFQSGYKLLKAISKLPDELITTDIKYTIKHFWWTNYIFLVLMSTLQITGLALFMQAATDFSARAENSVGAGRTAIILNLIMLVMPDDAQKPNQVLQAVQQSHRFVPAHRDSSSLSDKILRPHQRRGSGLQPCC